jgi:pyruvate/2-oxoglutarate dehydrogenase complex dihydrolipoamide acyltransferase (E2) component
LKVVLKLPRLSMNMQEGAISEWLKQPGESFKLGEPIYSVETEKVTTEVEAPCAGTMLEILMPLGENVEVGTAVCRIEKVD